MAAGAIILDLVDPKSIKNIGELKNGLESLSTTLQNFDAMFIRKNNITATYVKMGYLVFAQLDFDFTCNGSGLQIGGLPFSVDNKGLACLGWNGLGLYS